MNTQVYEYPREEIKEQLASGAMAPFSEAELPAYIDCGDDRFLTDVCARNRKDISARIFGGASGLAKVTLIAVAMQNENGSQTAKAMVEEREHGIADFAADISSRAYDEFGIRVHQHSALGVEKHPGKIQPKKKEELGCAFNALLGKIVMQHLAAPMAKETIGRTIAFNQQIAKSDVMDARSTAISLVEELGGVRLNVSRSNLVAVMFDKTRKTPIAIVAGDHCDPAEASVVMDYGNFKAAANGKDYHHSARLPEVILPKLFPELNLDLRALKSASTVMGVATQSALGVKTVKVIPEDTQARLAA